MSYLRLIHWNADEARERAVLLKESGFDVAWEVPGGIDLLKEITRKPPAAVLIDLSRLPSQGRDLGVMIRKKAATRNIPLIFVGGDPEKVQRIAEVLPDAIYTFWEGISEALTAAIANPPQDPVVPQSVFEVYRGRPLAQKLGIKENAIVGVIAAPQNFANTLGDLPDAARISDVERDPWDLVIWFVRSKAVLERGIAERAGRASQAPLWIAWPKRASEMVTDLTQQIVRETGLAAGLVDYKICSIDEVWSALLFTQRKTK
jgi:CheY-like chemotaxis protein